MKKSRIDEIGAEAPPEPQATAEAAERPVLFLHIPRTGGGAMLLALRNLFGDGRVLQLDAAVANPAETIADLVATTLGGVACVAAQVPAHAVATHLQQFRPLTLLREPINRVFSLYRALRRTPMAEQQRMGLGPRFSFADFIGSRHPALFAQINNGMCRMLGGDAHFNDPDGGLFWRIDPPTRHAEQALAMLEAFDFGLTEEMAATERLLRARWGLPDAESATAAEPAPAREPESGIDQVQMVIRRNMLDLALYRQAAALFRVRATAAASVGVAAGSGLFTPTLNVPAGIAEIAGRQGFHATEPEGFAWLRADGPARIQFAAPARMARIQIQLACISDDYPIDRIVVQVNGRRVLHRSQWSKPGSCTLEIAPIPLRPEVNELAIDPPMFLSARQQRHDPRDGRYLSVALARITFFA